MAEISDIPTGRRLYLTVLFSDLSGSTQLGEALEAEDYAQMLHAMRRVCREIVARHGGHIARIQGDGLLAIFGYPAPLEDDGRRATEAALEIHTAVGRLVVARQSPLAGPLTMHSGIHSGLVYLLDGDIELGRFEIVGSVPNIAARLSDLAAGGEIVVSEETLGPQVHFFSTSVRESLQPKGARHPVAIYRVLGRAGPQRSVEARARRGLSPFVGREETMATLRDELRIARDGVPRCIAIAGEAGLGKTRLIEEFLSDPAVADFQVLRGYCENFLSAEPLQPFLHMQRGFADASREAMATPPAGDMISALASWIDSLAGSPLLIVIDDWQWADDASRKVLDAIRGLERPIFVLLATRTIGDEILASQSLRTIELNALSLGDTERALERLLPGADPFVIADIHRYAGGNPLFTEELCHSAAAEGANRSLQGGRHGRAWLEALIVSRVARLTSREVDILNVAAVLGNVFPTWLLKRMTGFGEDDPLVLALADEDFLFPSAQAGTMRFKHGITRDVVYGTVGLHQRRAIHLRVAGELGIHADAAALEDASELLAYHFDAGEQPSAAAHYYEIAGDKAMAALALDRARDQFSAALRSLDALGSLSRELQLRWCGIAGKLGMACVFDPLGVDDGMATFGRAVALAQRTGDTAVIARAEYWMGYICYARGLPRDAAAHCSRSLSNASTIGDERLAAQVQATLGQVLVSAADYDNALPMLDAAVSGKRRQAKAGSRMAVGSAYTLSCKGCLLGDRGDFALAQECFDEALTLLGDSTHQVASSVAGWIAAARQWQGRWQEALEVSEASALIAENVRSRQLLAMSRSLSGYSRWMIGGDVDAVQALRDATAWIEKREGAFITSLNYGWLVDCTAALGLIDESRRHAARLLLRARQRDCLGLGMGCRALALQAGKAGRMARAEHLLSMADRSARARASRREIAMNQLCRARVAVLFGRAAEAAKSLDLCTRAFESMRMTWYLEQASRLRPC